jgi:hypothetical protein
MKISTITGLAKVLILVVFLVVSISASAQSGRVLNGNTMINNSTTTRVPGSDQQTDYLRKLYTSKVEAPKELINGKEYETYYGRSKVKPLLFFEKKRSASIITRTRRYNNLTLQYDTFLDEVVYTDTSRTINSRFPQIALNKDIVEGFNLYFEGDSIIFRYFREPASSDMNLEEGFYEVAYEGNSKYVIKHKSSDYVKDGFDNYKYSPENYINTGNGFYKTRKMKDLLRLTGDRSEEVKRFIKTTNIRIKKADKRDMISILKFYDSLISAAKRP